MWRHGNSAFGDLWLILLNDQSLKSIIAPDGLAGCLFAFSLDLPEFYIAAPNYLLIVLRIKALWRRLDERNIWLRYR